MKLALITVVAVACFSQFVVAEGDVLWNVWPKILQKMAYASDNVGHDLTEQLIGMLPGLDREINRGQKKPIFESIAIIELLEQKIYPHVLDPEIKAEFQKVNDELEPVMDEIQKTGSIKPLQDFIHSGKPGTVDVTDDQIKT